MESQFDCATALFDVINYIPRHDWWKKIPVKKGGYFLFDIWDIEKIKKEGFCTTQKQIGGVGRQITPINISFKSVDLLIDFWDNKKEFREKHRMYLYSHEDILRFCGKKFGVADVKQTKNWQTWYKCNIK